jgi:hypothetical protein
VVVDLLPEMDVIRKQVMNFVRLFTICTAIAMAAASAAEACPFCSAVSMTFGEEMKQSEVVVIAELVTRGELPKDPTATAVPGASDSTFKVTEVLKGGKLLGESKIFKAVYFGKEPLGAKFLVLAAEPPKLNWSAPIKLSQRGVAYVQQSSKLPEEGVERLAFFQKYLNDKEPLLSQDSYDEFAKADYKVIQALKPHMDRKQLLAWVQNPEMPASRRRLFFTMLGVCGEKQDIAVLERLLRSKDTKAKTGLDALIASYLTLKGPEGMDLVEELFIKNSKTPFTETYKAIMALRFLGEDESAVSRKRVLQALRLMLERPKYADLVIPDLARWEDWKAMPRLVQLFKEATKENSWVRVPVLRYLQACPLPDADEHIIALSKLDPAAARRAASFFPVQPPKDESKKDTDKKGTAKADAAKADSTTSDTPATDRAPKSASETAAPTTTPTTTAHRVDKPSIAETPSVNPNEQVAIFNPLTIRQDANASPISALNMLLAFGGCALLLAFAMWSLLFGSARYEKIARHGVRRK